MRPYKTEFEKAVFERAFNDKASLDLKNCKLGVDCVLNYLGEVLPRYKSRQPRHSNFSIVALPCHVMNNIFLSLEKDHEKCTKEILELISAEVEKANKEREELNQFLQ